MNGVSTAFWLAVLGSALFSIAAGFVGGGTVGARALPPPPVRAFADLPPPPPIVERRIARALTGTHSIDGADEVDPYGDPAPAVAEHAWPGTTFDGLRDRARIAIVADASRAAGVAAAFVSSPMPLTLAVAPGDDGAADLARVAQAAGKTVLVDASTARAADVAELAGDALGVFGSLDAPRARALVAAVAPGALVVDAALREDDALASVARARGARCSCAT